MAKAYATPTYYEQNFGAPPAVIADRLGSELARASRYLRAQCTGIDARIARYREDPTDDSAIDPDLVADVVCEMVKTAASGSAGGVGVSNLQQSAGPFQATVTFVNPVGDLYFSRKQRQTLGCGTARAGNIDLIGCPA